MEQGFTILEHPSDIGIEAKGRSRAEAFELAAAGMMSLIVDPAGVVVRESHTVRCTAGDPGQLLVKWLSEILYLYDGRGFVSKAFTIHRITSLLLDATVGGEILSAARHATKLDVKAVTYHQLSVRDDEEGAVVRVYLDI